MNTVIGMLEIEDMVGEKEVDSESAADCDSRYGTQRLCLYRSPTMRSTLNVNPV